MIKIKLSGRPTARFFLELDRAIRGEFEYFVDSDCVLHLWAANAAEPPRAGLLEEFVTTVEKCYANDRVLCDMRRAVEAIRSGAPPYQALGLVPPARKPVSSAEARENEFRTAVQVYRTLSREGDLGVAVGRAIRNRGLSKDDQESVVRWYRSHRKAIDVLRSDIFVQGKPAPGSP